ncbi:uncharacterized protein [Solanum lycopersicum]|uniref:uncharacterized protein n=1 Tax=Solanum lycopersicum TaxID=4081 RepID=UPI003749E0D0
MTSKTNEGADSSVVLTPFFYGTDFEYWKIRMRTHLKAEDLWTIIANGFEEQENDGDLTTAEMKNLEAKYRQDAKSVRKIQMEVSRAYFAKIATCETAKKLGILLKLRRMVTKRNHSDTIFEQQVVESILISVTENYEYIVAITEETKDLSKLSIKELVGSFRAHEKRSFFRKDRPKETEDHDGSSKKVEEQGEKNSSLFCKVCKKTNHNVEKCWHKGKPQCNFCKMFGHVEKDCWHKKREQANFCEKHEEEREENLFFASKSDDSTKSNEWCPTKALKDKTPVEAWSGIKPSVSYFKKFGCICYAHVPAEKITKLDEKSQKCVFLGYSDVTKGYRLLDDKTNKLVVSRDVIFDEKTTWNWEDKKIENTTVISLNQEEDEKDEDVSQGREIPDSDNEEPPPRGTKILSDIYQRCNFSGVEPKNYEEAIKHDVWQKTMEKEI